MNQNKLESLEQESVFKAIMKLALPMMLGMIVQILYNIADTYFIGQLNDPYQMAAVSVSMPMFMVVMGLSGIFGNGGAAYLSRLLGEKDYKGANETASIAMYSCIFLSIIISILGLIFLKPIVSLLGTSSETFQYAYDYSFIIILGSIIVMSNFSMAQLLRAEGAAKEAMIGMFIGTAVNITLDPLLIFVFDLGVQGVAIATVIGNGCALIYYYMQYIKKKSIVSIKFSDFSFKNTKIFYEILIVGVPASLNHILMSIANILINNIAEDYGDIAVAGMGISFRIIMISTFLMIGVAMGAQPLIGYNYGAKKYERLKEIIKKVITIDISIGLVCMTIFWLFAKALINLFIEDEQVINTGISILRALTLSLPFIGIQMVTMVSLQAMGKGTEGLIISISRQGIVFIPTLFLLNYFFGFYGFIYTQPISDVLAMFLSVILFSRILSKLKHKDDLISTLT